MLRRVGLHRLFIISAYTAYTEFSIFSFFRSFKICHLQELDPQQCVRKQIMINPVANTKYVTCKIFHQNLIFILRSSLNLHGLPSQKKLPSQLKCFICGQIKDKDVKEKYRSSKIQSASKILQAANHFMDEVYVKICDLASPGNILSADLYHQHTCYSKLVTYENTSHHYAVKKQQNTVMN